MSLILEALKKSEAERRLGQAPGLMTPMPEFSVDRSNSVRWIAGVIVVLIVVALGVAGWLRFSNGTSQTAEHEPSAALDPVVPVEATPQTESSTVDASRPSPTTNAAPPEPALAPSSVATSPPPALRPVEPDLESTTPAPRDPEFDSVERESIAVAPEFRPAPPPSAIAAPPVVEPPQAEPTVSGDPLGIATADLPRLDQLSVQERDALPALKMSMHLYADDPSARFALIDGKRLTEGDALAPSLRLVTIRRDGAELEFNGRHFLLPRP